MFHTSQTTAAEDLRRHAHFVACLFEGVILLDSLRWLVLEILVKCVCCAVNDQSVLEQRKQRKHKWIHVVASALFWPLKVHLCLAL